MTDRWTLTPTRLLAGIWEGVLSTDSEGAPPLEARHLDRLLPGPEVTPVVGKPGQYAVRLAIPADVLGDGVQTVTIVAGDEVLAAITIVAGTPLDDDLRTEIGLLRAELDLLKRAFRRHCAETAS